VADDWINAGNTYRGFTNTYRDRGSTQSLSHKPVQKRQNGSGKDDSNKYFLKKPAFNARE
jgi:hypothetical protein